MGEWESKTTDSRKFPTDFSLAPNGYIERVKYMTTEVPMFGTPSINMTTKSINRNDPNDIHTSVGFLTLKPATNPLKTFLMSTNNEGDITERNNDISEFFIFLFQGVATIEEGTLINSTILFTLIYVHSMPETVQGLPRSVSR